MTITDIRTAEMTKVVENTFRAVNIAFANELSMICDKLGINPADKAFDVVYINGDHNIPTVLTQTAEEGGATRVLKLRQIEPEFLERMFSVEDI